MKKWLGLILLLSLPYRVDADPPNEVMGQLLTREHKILMIMGADEPLFTIFDMKGEVLVSQRTSNEIESENVDLFHLVEELIANQQGRGASFLNLQAKESEMPDN